MCNDSKILLVSASKSLPFSREVVRLFLNFKISDGLYGG